MPTQVQIRGATAVTQNARTLASRELDIDITNKRLSVHDGVTAGGIPHVNYLDFLNQRFVYEDATGTDSLTITLPTAPTAYAEGMSIMFKAQNTNTGAMTINVNSLGAKNIKKASVADGALADIEEGEVVQGGIYRVTYDTTQFIITGLGAGGAGAWTVEELTITSGNSFELTNSLPAGVTEIKVFFADCQPDASTGSSSRLILELGDSGGYETSGYESTLYTGTNLSTIKQTDLAVRYLDGFSFLYGFSAGAQDMSGVLNLNLMDESANHWSCDSIIRFHHQTSPNAGIMIQTGEKELSGTLTSLRVNTPDGSTQVFEGSSPKVTLWYR